MTLIRKAALNILKLVISLASPSSRVWAEAALGELSSIESDWVAVRWALGSMHVLFTSTRGHTMTMSEVPAAAKALTSRMTQRTWVGSTVVIATALFFIRLLSHVPNTLQRTGCAVLVLAMLYMLFQLVSARPRRVPVGTDLLAQVDRYRSELGREWNFHRGLSFWSRLAIIIPGFLLLAIGRIFANPASITSNAVQSALFLFFAALSFPKSQSYANRYAAQLHELEQLHDKQQP